MKCTAWAGILVAVCFVLFAATISPAADRYWVGAKSGNWSDAANWSAASGGAGGAGVPSAGDTALFDGKGVGDSTVDGPFAGKVGDVRVLPGYTGTIMQERGLTVAGDMKIAGGSRIGWTFADDKPADLVVKGSLSVTPGKFVTCTRASTAGLGVGRTITVGRDLLVDGTITADGKGFMKGPGTPIVPVAKDDPNVSKMEDRYVSGANVEALKNACIVSPAGPGHGGRGAGIYRNPNGQYTVQPHSYYWTEPLGSGSWKYPGGSTYGSIIAPTSLGSGTDADANFNPKKPYAFDAQDTFWTHKGVYGGGAIKLVVGGTATVNGRVTANGAVSGETGASGGSIYIIAGNLKGEGIVSANGSDGPGQGHGRGGGGGGRVAVVLKKSSSPGSVRLQAFGGEGRWSPAAAAGTIYFESSKDKAGSGTLVLDNGNKPVRSMYDINTSISDEGAVDYSFKSVVLRNHAVLYVGKNAALAASAVTSDDGNVLLDGGKLDAPKMTGLRSKDIVRPQDEMIQKDAPRIIGAPVTVFTFGKAYTMQQELLNRSLQMSLYPYISKIDVSVDLSTYAFPAEVASVKSADVTITSKTGTSPVARGKIALNDKQFGQTTIDIPGLADGTYVVNVALDNGMAPAPMTFDRKALPWEHNTLGVTDKVYPPFEPLSTDGNTVKLSSKREYVMNSFGMFDRVVSEGKDLTSGPITIHYETASGEGTWTPVMGKFVSSKPNIAEWVAQADGGAVKLQTQSQIEFDGCTKVEMNITLGDTNAPEIKRMWIEIPLKDSETPLFHYTQVAGMRWNYAGKTPTGGEAVWESEPPQWQDRRPPIWWVKPGTEGKNDGLVWDSSKVRNITNWMVTPFVPYVWLGGGSRGLAWFADSDKGWITDENKPDQVITREGGKLVMRLYIVNKPTKSGAPLHIVFGLQASPTRPMMPDWRTVDRFAVWGYMTPALGMFCCTKFPIDHDMSLVDQMIQNGKDTKAGKKVTTQFLSDKVDDLTAKGWEESMTPDAYLKRWTTDPWNGAAVNGPMRSVYFEEHWTDPGQSDVDQYGNEWAARRYLGAWPIREKNRIVYDSPSATASGETGRFISGDYTQSLVDFSVYYGNEYLKRGISLYFDNTYPHTSTNPTMTDAYFADDGRVQPSVQLWAQRDYYRRIWNLANEYNEKGMNPPLWFSQHMTNTMILPWTEWTTCNLDNENAWTDVGRKLKPAVFPWDFLLTESVGRQVGVPSHSHWPIGGQGATPRREWGMRMVHEITNRTEDSLFKLMQGFGYGTDGAQVFNYWSDEPPFKVANDDVKWLGMTRAGQPSAMILLQSYSFDPTSTKVRAAGCKAWMNAETGAIIPSSADGTVEIGFAEGYGTILLVAAPSEAGLKK